MKLEAPWPPSLNALWRTMLIGVCSSCRSRAHATLYKSQQYQDYVTQLQLAMLEQEVQPIRGTPALIVTAHFYRPRKVGDLDNSFKAMFDVMGKGRVYADDSQVVELHGYRHDDKARPRVEIEISELPTNETAKQEALFDLETPTSGGNPPASSSPVKPLDARGVGDPPARPRASLPPTLEQRLRRLAQPATVSHRGDE